LKATRHGPLAALVVVAIALLLLMLVAVAPLLVDRDALSRRIETEVGAALGLPVELTAITALGLLPTPHAVLGPLRVLPRIADDDQAAPTPSAASVIARTLRIELAWPALLRGRAEPVLAHAQGLELDWRPGPGLPPPRWLSALPAAALHVRGGTLALDYAPGAERLAWPLFGSGPEDPGGGTGTGRAPAQRLGPLRLAATLPLDQTEPHLAGIVELTGQLDLTELPALGIAPLTLTGKELDIGEVRGLSLALSAERAHRAADGRWRLERFAVTSGRLRLAGSAAFSQAHDGRLAGEGRLSLAPLDLRQWLAQLRERPLPGRPETLRCIAADGTFTLGDGLLTIAPVALRADTIRAGAAATVRLGPVPAAAVDLRLDRLDLDPYLAPAGTRAADTAPDPAPCDKLAAAAAAPPPPRPPAHPPELRLHLAAAALRAGALTYGDLIVRAEQRGPLSGADVEAADFYGGSLSVRLEQTLQAKAPPRYLLRADIRGADLGALLTDLQGSPQATGTADLMADLAAAGADEASIRRDLSGTVRIDLRDARLAALDQAAANFAPLLAAVGLPLTPDTLALSRLGLGAQGRSGVFDIVDIDGHARLFQLGGAGKLDASAETLDLEGLAGIRVPISVGGSMTAPKVNADLAPALAEAAGRTAKRHLNGDGNIFKQLEDATGVEGLEQGLRSLFGL
jgi:hypothetical protein